MNKTACALALISCAWGHAAIADEFQDVRCGADIPKALIGRHSSNGRVAVLEKKYGSLGLKDLGSDEISDRLSSVSWRICGAEFVLLIDRGGLVRDVLPFPQHSRQAPAFSGNCQLKGRELPDVVLAILDGASAEDLLPVQSAWKIDQQHVKFVKASSEGLLCPRSGIYTVDGGP
ncbi:MAG: hypothetical protein P4M07_21245 [Xanthobacteraceae bacterium]|nr:hypothetical protein [Xanthobacteraceae bacterium]